MLLNLVVIMFFWQLRLAYSDQREEIIFLQTQLRARDAKIAQLEKENDYLREKSQRWGLLVIIIVSDIYVQHSRVVTGYLLVGCLF